MHESLEETSLLIMCLRENEKLLLRLIESLRLCARF